MPTNSLFTLDDTPALLWQADAGGARTSANKAWRQRFGLSVFEWIQRVHPADRDIVHDRIQHAAIHGVSFECRYRIRRTNGPYVAVHDRGAPVFGEGDEVCGFSGVTFELDAIATDEARDLRRQGELLDQVASAVAAVDLEGTITSWNAGAERIFGYSRAEAIGRNISFLYPPEDTDPFEDIVTDLLIFERLVSDPIRVAKSGERIPVRVNIGLIRDSDGDPIGVSCCSLDQRARRRNEKSLQEADRALRKSEAQLRAAFEHLPFDSWMCDAEGSYTYVNPSFAARFPDTIGRRPSELDLPKALIEQWEASNARALAGEVVTGEISFELHGHVRTFVSMLAPVKEGSRVTGLIGVNVDITARKEAETALHDQSVVLRNTQRLAGVGWWSFDVASRLLEWSPEIFAMFGMDSSEPALDFDGFLSKVLPEDRDRVAEDLRNAVESGRGYGTQFRIVRPDGSLGFLRTQGELSHDEAGNPVRIFGAVLDDTDLLATREELHQSQEQLLQAQKMEAIGRLAGGIAHDFNNLLVAILGYADRLGKELPNRSDVRGIEVAAERAAALTSELLTFSRQQPANPEPVNIDHAVGDLSELLRRIIGDDVELALSLESRAHVMIDRARLTQILMNLTTNSRDAMPAGGLIKISTSMIELPLLGTQKMGPGRLVEICFSDSGTGMDAKTRAHAFEPFFTTKELGRGTGLGLSNVYGLVRQAGGEVTLTSTPGEGTTFRIWFPESNVAESAIPIPPRGQSSAGSERVLLIEDEDLVREFTAEVLLEAGYQVCAARHGAEAVELCVDGFRPALVISDLVMPGMSGETAVERIKEIVPAPKALFVSGYTDCEVPGTPFLQKPYRPSELLRRVRAVLDGVGAG